VGHKRRRKPKRLAEKLLTIRLRLSLSQNQLAKLLEFEKGSARISEYEHGNREPDLVTLLIYANLARVSMDVLVNDDLELRFRKDWKAPREARALLMQEVATNTARRLSALEHRRNSLMRH
jgi:transcriptional regulator with XRE-family HTH domain